MKNQPVPVHCIQLGARDLKSISMIESLRFINRIVGVLTASFLASALRYGFGGV